MTAANERQAAIQRHEQYASLDPDNLPLHLTLGRLYQGAHLWEDARRCFEKCLLIAPEHAGVRSRLAWLLLDMKEFAAAEALLRETLERGMESGAVLHNLGVALYGQSRLNDAESMLRASLQVDPSIVGSHKYLARIHHHRGDFAQAVQAAQTWSKADRTGESAGYLALLHMEAGDAEVAAEQARQLLRLDASNASARVVLGFDALDRLELEPAAQSFDIALRREGGNGRAWFGKGLTQLLSAQYTSAVASITHAVDAYPEHPGMLVTLGWAHLCCKDLEAAERSFERAVAANRNFAEAHGGLAVVWALQGQLERAETKIQVAQRLDAKGFGASFANVTVNAMRGRQAEASELMAELIDRPVSEGGLSLMAHLKGLAATRPTPSHGLH